VNIHRTFAAILLGFAGVFFVQAQPVNVQQFQNTQQAQQMQRPLSGLNNATNVPELYPAENADVGPQRILRLNPRPDYFDVFFDSQVFYSDNANFAQGSAIIGSAVFVNTVQAAFTPPDFNLGPGQFAPAAGYISQWYNYGNNRMTSLDFNAQTAFISGRYNLGYWQFGLGGNYTRLLNQGDYAQTYSEWMPVLTVQRIFPVGDNFIFVLGNQVDYHFTSVPATPGTSTEINNRFDDAVNLVLSWQMTRHLILQPYYRFQYSNYRYNTLQTSDRNDYLNSLGVTLVYNFNKNVSLRTFFNYNIKESDDASTPAYHEYNGGVGGTLNFSF
jgi:hypothetical protein